MRSTSGRSSGRSGNSGAKRGGGGGERRGPRFGHQSYAPRTEREEKPSRRRISEAAGMIEQPRVAVRAATLADHFKKLWSSLFESPVHLDSALSKLPVTTKSVLAQITPLILMKPVSTAEAFGVGIGEGEPWALTREQLARWKPAERLADRLRENMTGGLNRNRAVKEDFPPSMVAEWERDWGKKKTEQLVSLLAEGAPLSLRVARATDAKKLFEEMRKSSSLPVKAELSELVPSGIRLAGYAPVLNTTWFKEGAFEIQDEGSQLMALFALWPAHFADRLQDAPGTIGTFKRPTFPAAPKNLMTVVDACAGAGGKTLALADALGGRGRLYAYDISERKLQALRRRVSRAGFRNVQAVALDESKGDALASKFTKTADVVLVDAPCSGWGVLRRNSDIKWRQDRDGLERMPALQQQLLGRFAPLVKVGGRLVFGVCTFRKEETTEVVERFLQAHPQFERGPGGYLGPGPCDGFFMQVLNRKG